MERTNNRRAILSGAVALGATAAAAWRAEARSAIVLARATGRPVLSAQSITELFASNRALLPDFRGNPKAFVQTHFVLTPSQERALAALTAGELATISAGVNTAISTGRPINFLNCPQTPRRVEEAAVIGRSGRVEVFTQRVTTVHGGGVVTMNITGFAP